MKLSPWLPLPDSPHCCVRIFPGTDINIPRNRIAMIEKSPRVMLRKSTYCIACDDGIGATAATKDAWVYGPSGAGGPDGDNPANELYGYYPPSRKWCDDMLVLLGYELT